MGNDPANGVDPSGGITELPNVTVTASRRVAQTGSQISKVINTTTTTLKVVNQTYQIYQNKSGDQFETTNSGLGGSTTYSEESWTRIGERKETLYVEDDGLPSHMSGDRWQDRLKYFYEATHDLPNGSGWDEAMYIAEYRWNISHSYHFGNQRWTNDAFTTGGKEMLYAAPTAIEPTDGPESLIGGGMFIAGLRGLALKSGTRSIIKQGLKGKYDDLVSEATRKYGGNVTVQRNGKDLFRVHQSSSGHGYKVDQLNRIRQTPKGPMAGKQKVPVRKKHIRQLERALKGDPNYNLRTSSGK